GMNLLLRHSGDEAEVLRAPLIADPGRRARRHAEIPLAAARPGPWHASVEIDGLDGPAGLRADDGGGVLGPVTASLLPPRRVHVRPDRAPLAVYVTVPLAARLRRARRNLTARARR
ncbi:hypothetical protein, partial [Actinomadura sp. KC345]|uniref:hypothetical protein n=1 Tax=Actinomadura sp. KC345 TaxID=2530371 RepID=UPI00140533BE